MLEQYFGDVPAQLTVIGHVALAMFLGGLIGLEREFSDKPAGFRTHILVAGAAALLVGLADALVTQFSADVYREGLRTDPIRIVEAIVTGIAFLGAGTIIRRAGDTGAVEGLTTAASILLVASIGIAVALDQLIVALGVTVITLLVLRFMTVYDRWTGRTRRRRRD